MNESKDLKCRFCAKISTTKSNNKQHEGLCKLAKDPICYLQMTRCVDIGEYKDKECRFCNKVFDNRSNYLRHILGKDVCKTKYVYGRGLMDGIASNTTQQLITDNRVTNNIVNNFYILKDIKDTNYMIENDEELKAIVEDLASDNDLYKNDVKKYKTPINHLLRVHSKNENKNLKCPNERRNTILVFKDAKFKREKSETVLKDMLDKVHEPIEAACEVSGGASLVAGEKILEHLKPENTSNRTQYVKENATEFRRGISNIEHGDAVNL